MTRYTKKPVTVEAVQFTGDNWQEIKRFVPESVRIYDMNGFRIKTLEGEMKVSTGDFIIKGVKGEFYPCKPDIFQQTYIREGKTNVKPKACPFCGKKPHIYKVPKFPKGYYWTVQCERLDVIVHTRSMQSKKDAIEAWNRRAEVRQNAKRALI